MRSTAHGISAASGKVGSIAVVVWFNYASTSGKFWIVWPAALTGAFVTWIFIADTTGMDLAEAVCPCAEWLQRFCATQPLASTSLAEGSGGVVRNIMWGAGEMCGVMSQIGCVMAEGVCLPGSLCLPVMPRAGWLSVHRPPACAALEGCRLARRDHLQRGMQAEVYHA